MKRIARRLLLEALSRCTVTSPGLPALTYHSIDESGSAISFPLTFFRAQLEWLASQGFRSLTVSQATEVVTAGDIPSRSVALTFDDGFMSVWETAFPILVEYGFVATVFCATGCLGHPCSWERAADIPPFTLMPWEGVRFLASQGWEIGAHTVSHARLPQLTEEARKKEIRESRRILEQELGRAVTSFAYPYGAFDEASTQAVKEAGLKSAWTMKPMINTPGRDPYLLGRFNCNRVQSDSPRTAALAAQVCLGQRYNVYAFLTGRALRHHLQSRR